MSEEHLVAFEVPGVTSPGENSLKAQFHLGKATGLQTVE